MQKHSLETSADSTLPSRLGEPGESGAPELRDQQLPPRLG